MFLGLACLLTFFTLSAQDVIVYCDDGYPPYSFSIDHEAAGVYTEILNIAFSRMEDFNVEIRAVPWKRGLKLLETGEGFALFPPYYLPVARPYIDYSAPILIEKVVPFYFGKIEEEKHREKWPEDFFGLLVGQNAGFDIGGEEYNRAREEGLIFQAEAPDNRTNILKLLAGRIDVYINDRLSILWEAQAMIEEGLVNPRVWEEEILEGPTIDYEYGYLGFTNRNDRAFPYKEAFRRQFNEIVGEMRANGEIEAVLQKYMPAEARE